jgi:hypothetical protein
MPDFAAGIVEGIKSHLGVSVLQECVYVGFKGRHTFVQQARLALSTILANVCRPRGHYKRPRGVHPVGGIHAVEGIDSKDTSNQAGDHRICMSQDHYKQATTGATKLGRQQTKQ